MLAYYDCIITRETFRSKLSRTFKLAKKQQAYFSSFGDRRTEPVLRLQLFPLFHPLLPFSIDQHRNKTTTNTTIPNVSLPSSIAGTIYFDLDQCLPTNLFQIATKRFPFLPLYSKIFKNMYANTRASELFYSSNRTHRTNPTSI